MEISVRSMGNESRARTVASDVDDGIENGFTDEKKIVSSETACSQLVKPFSPKKS